MVTRRVATAPAIRGMAPGALYSDIDAMNPDPSDPLAALSTRLAALAEAGAARTVAVHGRDGRPRSGLLWAEDLVVTAEEALERDDAIVLVLPDGTRVGAELAGRDPGTDIALLRAPTGPVDPLPLATAEAAAAGHLVLALGRGEHGAFNAVGSIALAGPAWRSMRGGKLERRLELGLRLAPEAEGGPVLDHAGRLLGMAVPARASRCWRSRPRPSPAWSRCCAPRGASPGAISAWRCNRWGCQGECRGGRRGARAVIVVGLDPDGPGAKAGVLLGDVVTGWNGAPVTSVRELLARLDPEMVGREVALDLLRAGASLRLTVRIAERAAA